MCEDILLYGVEWVCCANESWTSCSFYGCIYLILWARIKRFEENAHYVCVNQLPCASAKAEMPFTMPGKADFQVQHLHLNFLFWRVIELVRSFPTFNTLHNTLYCILVNMLLRVKPKVPFLFFIKLFFHYHCLFKFNCD